jgi:two-component sensor histidine kinase
MGKSISAHGTLVRFPCRPAVVRNARAQKELDAAIADLQAAIARTEALQEENEDLLQRQNTLVQEFDRRLVNGLQAIASLLSAQSHTAISETAMRELAVAARHIAALGCAHRRRYLLDHDESIEVSQYFQHLCEDLRNDNKPRWNAR